MARKRYLNESDDFEQGLAALVPQVSGVDRDQLIFLAGQQAAAKSRGPRWMWPAATVTAWLVTAVMAIIWSVQSIDRRDLAQPRQPAEHRGTSGHRTESDAAGELSRPQSKSQVARKHLEEPTYFRLRQIGRVASLTTVPELAQLPPVATDARPTYRVIASRTFDLDLP